MNTSLKSIRLVSRSQCWPAVRPCSGAATASSLSGSFISQAEARVGRPATPMSYAGVARRTTRRTVAYGAAAGAAAAGDLLLRAPAAGRS